jgi:hypothetical protein
MGDLFRQRGHLRDTRPRPLLKSDNRAAQGIRFGLCSGLLAASVNWSGSLAPAVAAIMGTTFLSWGIGLRKDVRDLMPIKIPRICKGEKSPK